jgi:hypothetical protein
MTEKYEHVIIGDILFDDKNHLHIVDSVQKVPIYSSKLVTEKDDSFQVVHGVVFRTVYKGESYVWNSEGELQSGPKRKSTAIQGYATIETHPEMFL